MTMHKLYLDPFMDMYNGEILSYGISKTPSAVNVMTALEAAIKITADCRYRRTFHSDQGWAYQMKDYVRRLSLKQGILGSNCFLGIANKPLNRQKHL